MIPSAHDPKNLHPGEFWACERPEDPDNPFVAYFASCYACWISAYVAFRAGFSEDVRLPGGGQMPMRDRLMETGLEFGHFDRARIDPDSLKVDA